MAGRLRHCCAAALMHYHTDPKPEPKPLIAAPTSPRVLTTVSSFIMQRMNGCMAQMHQPSRSNLLISHEFHSANLLAQPVSPLAAEHTSCSRARRDLSPIRHPLVLCMVLKPIHPPTKHTPHSRTQAQACPVRGWLGGRWLLPYESLRICDRVQS